LNLRITNVSDFSFETPNIVLSNALILVESEDAFLNLIFNLGPDYFELLTHIEARFLGEEELSILVEYFISLESLWHRISARFELLCFDSRIISSFLNSFREFLGK
jgi:hypothetical protein